MHLSITCKKMSPYHLMTYRTHYSHLSDQHYFNFRPKSGCIWKASYYIVNKLEFAASLLWNSLPTDIQSSPSLPLTSKNISFSTIISWFCIVTLLRLCGLRNSSAILATIKNFDWHWHWIQTALSHELLRVLSSTKKSTFTWLAIHFKTYLSLHHHTVQLTADVLLFDSNWHVHACIPDQFLSSLDSLSKQ